MHIAMKSLATKPAHTLSLSNGCVFSADPNTDARILNAQRVGESLILVCRDRADARDVAGEARLWGASAEAYNTTVLVTP